MVSSQRRKEWAAYSRIGHGWSNIALSFLNERGRACDAHARVEIRGRYLASNCSYKGRKGTEFGRELAFLP
jgi:hypothetical protein